tara:strand:+ start:5797 stop:5994 length:198 start_codon:yes stop_codon:yes gene_type:complete
MHVIDIIRSFKTKCDAEITEIGLSLAAGHCPDFHTYQKFVGEVSGLEKAKSIADETLKLLHEEDD